MGHDMATAASRYLFLFLIGLVLGVIGTVMGMRALDARKDHFHESVMHVMQHHLGAIKTGMEQNRCAATDVLPHLQTLRRMGDDLEPAFPELADDARFAGHASKLRATLDAALASPPLNCAGAGAALQSIGGSCKACHDDFRS